MSALWSDDEMFELKHQLLCTNYALEQEEALEIAMYQEPIRHVYQLWKTACQERDEARDQLQKVVAKNSELQKLIGEFLTSNPAQTSPLASQIKPETYPLKGTEKIPNATEPNYISDTFKNHSHGSPPGDCISYEILSPTLSNSNMSDSSNSGLLQQPFIQYSSGCIQMGTISSLVTDNPDKGNLLPDFSGSLQMGSNNPVKGKLLPDSNGSIQMGAISLNNAMGDHASVLIDNLAKKRPLPEKGNLFLAVMEAGPLLETLLVSGPPVPKWRNPPNLSLLQAPFCCSVDGDHGLINQTGLFDSNSAIPSSSLKNFEHSSSSCVNIGHTSPVGINAGFMHQVPIEKRRRLKLEHESFSPLCI